MVVAMRCENIHVNVQDASGDRILASSALRRQLTSWSQWSGHKGVHELGGSAQDRKEKSGERKGMYSQEDVHDYLGAARRKKRFAKTPTLPRGDTGDSCRIFGSLDGNKVQGDFHITARGHGYMEFAQHLDHSGMHCLALPCLALPCLALPFLSACVLYSSARILYSSANPPAS